MSEPQRTVRKDPRPLIAHVIHRFDVGGMENGVVNLVNRLPSEIARHCILALTEADSQFKCRILRSDVEVYELRKPKGQTMRIFPGLYRLLKRIRPAIVHTRNSGTLETQAVSWMAGVPIRIHGEHGWDPDDLEGRSRKLLAMRKVMRFAVHEQIALSLPATRYLVERVGVPASAVTTICNGVDIAKYSPPLDKAVVRARLGNSEFGRDHFVVGTVGRVAKLKNIDMLADAFALVAQRNPTFAARARLAIVGDGPDMAALRDRIARHRLDRSTWLPGVRGDVAACLQAFDIFCLPSLSEGISNAILEAMASGLPVVATRVGGNPEIVTHGETGFLVESQDAGAMANRIEEYFDSASLLQMHSAKAHRRALESFSIDHMVARYAKVYQRLLERRNHVAG